MTTRRLAVYIFAVFAMLASVSPLLAAFWASDFARRHGCDLHEGFTQPCVVNGEDWGETLYTAFVSGWLVLLTLPVLFVAMAVLLWLVVVDLIRYFRSGRQG